MPRRITRRRALSTGLAGLGAIVAGGPYQQRRAQAAGMVGSPNILWLVSEDNNPFLGCFGDPVARTPNLDLLATQGVRYAACFSAAPVCAPSRFALITGMYPTTTGPAEHQRAQGHRPSWLVGFPQLLRAAGYYCTNNAKTDYNVAIDMPATWDASSTSAHWRNRPAGAPFFSVFNFDSTHEDAVFPWGSQPLPDGVSPSAVRIPAYLPDTTLARADRARYYDQVTVMDRQVADLLGQLSADGLAEDTIVFYYSDNGGVLPRTKRFCYDSGLHTPLIVRFPTKYAALAPAPPGAVVSDPVSSVDFAPTVLGLAGVAVPAQVQGQAFAGPGRTARTCAFSSRDRMDHQYDMVRTVRTARHRYIRNYLPHLPYGRWQAYAWSQAGYREWERLHLAGGLPPVQEAFWAPKPTEELYDLDADPDEVHNLIDAPDLATLLADLRSELDRHLLAVNDNGFIPEGSPLEGYDASRVAGRYPLTQVLQVAGTAITRQPANAAALTSWLRDPNVIVRMWAARGCRMMPGGVPAAVPDLVRLLSDGAPGVRAAAGEALCVSGEVTRGLDALQTVLLQGLKSSHRLLAANALDSLGEVARPALAALQQASKDRDRQVRDSASHTVAVLTGTYHP